MTTFHEVILKNMFLMKGFTPEESMEQAQLLVRSSARAATDFNAVAWISEDGYCEWDEESEPLGAVIPAKLAKELIAEGRLNHPVMASATVVDWSSWREKKD